MAIRTSVAIDVGPFELGIGIYEMSYKIGVRHADHIRHVVALGGGTYSESKVSYDLVGEVCQVLGELVQIMKTYWVKDYRAYATDATRKTYNNQIILEQIRVRAGLNVRIISDLKQRFTSYKAIAAMIGEFNKVTQKGMVIVDVGSGSIQLSPFDKDASVITQNLPLGTLRIRGLLAKIPATVNECWEQIEEIVDNELFTFRKMYLKNREINNLAGVGENILYIINHMDLKAYGDKTDAAAMNRFYDRLCQLATDQIKEKFGTNSEYTPLFLPSTVIYKRTLELTGAEMFWVPSTRLCDEIVAKYAQGNKLVKSSRSFENNILIVSRNMARYYKYHTSHNQVLKQYALGIFGNMKRCHGLGSRRRLLLQIAVLLHACGKFISVRDSNECSYNIIMSTEIIGLDHLGRKIITSVVRYNIRNFDYNEVQLETQLLQENVPGYSRSSITILIAKPTAVLWLTNSMDRNHRAKLVDCRMTVRDNELVITAGYTGDMALEASSFDQKADFFEEIFGTRPMLKQKRRM